MSRSDLDKIQGQLRQAIQSHQMFVARMKLDPQNATVQKQLHDLQAEITSLSEKQKVIVQQLRKDLVPKQGSENTPVVSQPSKPVASSSTSTSKPPLPVTPCTAPPMTISAKKERHFHKPHSRRKEMRPSSPIRIPSYPHHRPTLLQSNKTNVLGDYTQKISTSSPVKRLPEADKFVKENIKKSPVLKRELPLGEKQKFEFMAALDLVSPDTVKELQSKRTERKRRTTANPHFASGGYDSERRQAFSNYLASIGVKRSRGLKLPPRQPPTSGLTRLGEQRKRRKRTSNLSLYRSRRKRLVSLERRSCLSLEGRFPRASPNTSRPGTPDSVDSGAYRNGYSRNGSSDGDVHDDYCAMCHRSGQLLMCDTCSLVFHLQCLEPPLSCVPQGLWSCPKCQAEGRQIPQNPPNPVLPAALEVVNSYIANKAAKEEEKRKLLRRKSELQSERAQLELKSQQLNMSVNKQGDDKGALISMNNNTQASVDKIKKFIHVFQSC
ncbi:PHD finger protein 21A-like isoform X2 [Lineus longissimus]|uniref:PHD finger protein 21A-like isoform X2 n=1 Tax=Lineus longissimus TaxID=88925 RepID=UPI002B4F91A7